MGDAEADVIASLDPALTPKGTDVTDRILGVSYIIVTDGIWPWNSTQS